MEERLLHGQVRGGGGGAGRLRAGMTAVPGVNTLGGGGGGFMETFPRSIAAQPRPAGQGT
jgi:hypothetical protein